MFAEKVYDCNERIILSAIAFLTLPETVKELHRRLPAVTIPKLPSKRNFMILKNIIKILIHYLLNNYYNYRYY